MNIFIGPWFRLFVSLLKNEQWGHYVATAEGIGESHGCWFGWVHIGYWQKL